MEAGRPASGAPRPWRTFAAAAVFATACVLSGCSASSSSAPPARAGGHASPQTSSRSQALMREVTAIRQALQSGVDAGAFPGAVVVVRRDGQTRSVAVGRADVARRVPMTSADRFHIASVTKSMAAAVTLQLVAQGRLSLRDTVQKWEPGLLVHGGEITVGDLVGQTSGLPSFMATQGFSRMHGLPPASALVALVAKAPLMFRPGSRSYYSNTNYVVLGMILEKVTDESLPALFEQRLFAPLGLHSASLSEARAMAPPLAHGYDHGKDVTSDQSDLSWLGAAGAVVANAGDVSRFYDALFAQKIVPGPLLRAMRSQVPETNHTDVGFSGYGLGIATLPTGCGPVFGHSGSDAGFLTDAWATRNGDRSVVMAANASLTVANNDYVVAVLGVALCDP